MKLHPLYQGRGVDKELLNKLVRSVRLIDFNNRVQHNNSKDLSI